MNMKTIHRAYKDEIIRCYGFIGKIKVWNSNREPNDNNVLKMIEAGFKDFRDIILKGLDKTYLDRQMAPAQYKIYKFVAAKLTKQYVVNNFKKTACNTDPAISIYLDMKGE
ncbi:MAG TPA: hypothetical protein P5511_03215 [Candidatus Goldiibacteriota bacterium]|nr:hypothetical protein [Candidatus Goldiibacteriota bacterium]